MGHCGLRKPGTHRGKLKPVNGARAPFRTGKLFHGLDQPAQPRGLAISGTPRLRLSAHGPLHPCQLAKARLLVIPAPPTRSAPTLPERKSRRCDLLHKGLRRLGLNHHNGSENPSTIVRLTIGHRHRLCLGRHRRSSHTAGAGLPDPDLTSFPPFAPRFRTLSMFAPDKFHAFCEVCSRRDRPG
jgi:hypothetical protein